MFDIRKNYWLHITPSVYCCIKNGRAVLYDTQTGEYLESDDGEVIALLESLHEKKNLGCIVFEGKLLKLHPYETFVSAFCDKGMGGLTDMEQTPEKPIQLMPVLNLQRDMDKLPEDGKLSGTLLRYLLELNIRLVDSCGQSCSLCDRYYRQCLCCFTGSGNRRNSLDIEMLQRILMQIRYGTVGRLNFLGGNLFEYPYFDRLPELLGDVKERVHLWIHYKNIVETIHSLPDFFYDVVVPFPIEPEAWERICVLLQDLRVCYHFYATGMDEYEEAEKSVVQNGIVNYRIHPIFTDANRDFFEEYVYLDKADVFQSKLSFRQIFAHQKLNTNFFGVLTVLDNGDVYANINCEKLGNVRQDALLDIIGKEMIVNTAWRKIRSGEPCSGCLYQFLCSSPSNYEMIIGKPNLCRV